MIENQKRPIDLISKKPKKKFVWKMITFGFIILGLLFHVFYNIKTNNYLITSGIFLIISIAAFLYVILLLLKKVFNLRCAMRNIRLSITTVALCLIITEMIFILTGYKSTYHEKRYKYYYESHYKPEEKSWFHIWQNDHDLQTKEYCFHRKINSLGLSDIEHFVTKKVNEYRIIGLGDSFTEGDGADKDSTWLKFLERNLIKYDIKIPVTFINAGVCGSDPFFEYILLKEKLLMYKPDFVILAINHSDVFDVVLRGGMERFQKDNTIKYNDPPCIEPLYAISHLSRLIFDQLKYDEFLIRNFADSPLPEKAEEKIYSCLLLFKELSLKNNFRLLVVFHPFNYEISNNHLGLTNVLNKIKAGKSIEYLDLLEYFKSKEAMDKTNFSSYFWKEDGHHNSKGYAAFAKGVEWKLKEMGIIDSLMIE